MTAHRANEDQMIQCDKCAYWVHAECDGIDKAAFEALSKSDDAYACPNCRGERTATLLDQVLKKLDEDKAALFREVSSLEAQLAQAQADREESRNWASTYRDMLLKVT